MASKLPNASSAEPAATEAASSDARSRMDNIDLYDTTTDAVAASADIENQLNR